MNEINEIEVLHSMVADRFQEIWGDIKNPKMVKEVNYFMDLVQVVYQDGQLLTFKVTKE